VLDVLTSAAEADFSHSQAAGLKALLHPVLQRVGFYTRACSIAEHALNVFKLHESCWFLSLAPWYVAAARVRRKHISCDSVSAGA
jgi:hypothetical protein